MVGHFVAGFALCLFLHQHSENGLLQGTDEVRYVQFGRGLAQNWRDGNFMSYASIKTGDPNSGFYHVLASLDYLGISHPLVLRVVNVSVAFMAILLWWYALAKNKEKDSVRRFYLILLLLCPSMLFMSSWIIKEAWLYMFSGLVAVSIASLARSSVLLDQWKPLGLLIASLLLIAGFRGYEAIIIGLAFIIFVFFWKSWWKALLLLSIGTGIGMLFNYDNIVRFAFVITGLNLHETSLFDFNHDHYANALRYYESYISENRAGAAAIDASVTWLGRLWLFFSFPLPWQAQSILQKLVVPEVLAFLVLLPSMVYGMYLKLSRRDMFAIFVLVWFLLMSTLYITVNANLGTMYRHKASLMFIMLYFAAVGVVEIFERYKLRENSVRIC